MRKLGIGQLHGSEHHGGFQNFAATNHEFES
jgi:hypothetical protein